MSGTEPYKKELDYLRDKSRRGELTRDNSIYCMLRMKTNMRETQRALDELRLR